MAFPKMDFDGPKQALTKEITRQKQLNSYDAVTMDKRVQGELKRLVDSSLAIVAQVFKVFDENQKVAKKTMDEMEALIKKKGKKLSPSDVKIIETGVRTLERCAETMSDTSQDAMSALIEWRGGWPATYKELFSDPKMIDPFIARRKASIDENTVKEAGRKRVTEYVVRAKDLQKQAQQTLTRGGALAHDEANEVLSFKKDVTDLSKKLNDSVQKLANSFKPVLDLNPKQKLTPQNQKMYDEIIKSAQLKTKEVRGTLKTLTIKVSAFKKTASTFQDAAKKQAASAYADAAKLLKKGEDDEKKVAANEAKAIKHLTAIKKLK
jgi:hypothetical protein